MDVTMPQLGETVTEGTITRWLKQPGDPIRADEPLFEVSTDKVDSEVPAPTSGVLAEIRVAAGETAAVGTVLAVISDAAAPRAEPAAPPAPAPSPPPPAPAAPPPPPAPPAPAAPPPPAPPEPAPAPPAPAPPMPPVVPVPAMPSPVGADETEPSIAVPSAPDVAATVEPGAPAPGSSALTSPVVRRLITEHGLDPADITGTGEGGRITRKDVLDAAAASRDVRAPATAVPAPPVAPPPATAPPVPEAAPAPLAPVPVLPAPVPPPPVPPPPVPRAQVPAAPPASPPPPPPPPVPASPTPPPGPAPSPPVPDLASTGPRRTGGDTVVPFSNMRKRTAEHMVRSKATSPHVSTAIEVDYERVERVRGAHQAEWKAREGFTLTYLPFIARAFCDTVDQFPHVNASVVEDSLVLHRDVHLSVAVDLDFEGLIAPVVRDADGKRLRLIAREIHDLADRAKAKRLTPDEVLGGTFTITNPGPFGTYMTIPIINQPQVAILSTDGITKRPRVVTGPDGLDVIAVRHVGVLGLTWDHRAFDGAYAAAFLVAIRDRIEHHDWASELE